MRRNYHSYGETLNMKRLQSRLAIALLFGGLFILGFLGATLVSGPMDFLYRNAAGLATMRSVAQTAAILAATCLFITASIIAVSLAFQPAGRLGRVLDVLPLYLLGFTLLAIIASLLGIGTTGTLFNLGMAQITLTAAAIIVGVLLSTVAITISAARTPLSGRTLNVAMPMMGISAVPSVIAAAALAISVVIVATSQPNTSFGPPNGTQGQRGGQSAPGAAGTQAAQSPSSAPGNAPSGQGSPSSRANGSNQAGAARGGPGGGGLTSFVGSFTAGGALTAVFALIMLVSTVSGVRALRNTAASADSAPIPQINYRSEAASVIGAVAAISLVLFVVIQFVPVTRDNPPVQTTVQWDSTQTQQLWERTCADCHSNTTKWPWYSYIAPSSWLQTVHVTDARQQFNISQLNNIPTFRKSQFPDEAEQQISRGTMPPSDYLILHPEARLSAAEKQQLIQGLKNSLGSS